MSPKWLPLLIAPALLALACGGDGPSPAPSPTPTAAFRAFADEIDRAVQQRDLAFFRQRAQTEPVVCTEENTPPRGPGGPDCHSVGQQFDGFSFGTWRGEGGLLPLDTVLTTIERLWLNAVPGASDPFGGAAPQVYATGTSRSPDQAVYTAVLTALITRPAGSKDSGPLRAVLVISYVREGSGWRFVNLLSAFRGQGEEFLEPDPVIEGWVDDWQRFQPAD